jgi:hypothetical protein
MDNTNKPGEVGPLLTYFQKARELGQLLLESDQAKALAEANANGSETAKAEKDYQTLVNQVINMIKATVFEDFDGGTGNPCGGCRKK